MEIYLQLRTESECGKIGTRKTPNTSNFHAIFRITDFRTTTNRLMTYKKEMG